MRKFLVPNARPCPGKSFLILFDAVCVTDVRPRRIRYRSDRIGNTRPGQVRFQWPRRASHATRIPSSVCIDCSDSTTCSRRFTFFLVCSKTIRIGHGHHNRNNPKVINVSFYNVPFSGYSLFFFMKKRVFRISMDWTNSFLKTLP